MSLLWTDGADKVAIRRHAQRRTRVLRATGVQKPTLRPIAQLTPWPDYTKAQRSSLVFFELRTAREWSGWQDAAFWRLAMSMSHSCEAIASSLIALAKLHAGTGGVNEHMKAMRHRLQDCVEGSVSCLLIICFESLTGGRIFKLLKSGSSMMKTAPECVQVVYRRLKAKPCMMFLEHSSKMMTWDIASPVVPVRFETLLAARNCLEQMLRSRDMRCVAAWENALPEGADLLRAACLVGMSLLGMQVNLEHALDLIGPPTMSFGFHGGVIDMLGYIGTKLPYRRVIEMLQDRVEGDRVGAIVAGILKQTNGRLLSGKQTASKIELVTEHGVKELPFACESDARFGPGYAEYWDGDGWWRLDLEEFYFPIPRA